MKEQYNKYRVVYTGQGAGYRDGDIINVPKKIKKIEDIAWEINKKANLQFTDIGLLKWDEAEGEITFGTLMDGIVFKMPKLIVKKIN